MTSVSQRQTPLHQFSRSFPVTNVTRKSPTCYSHATNLLRTC